MMKIYADNDVCRWHLVQLNLEISDEITAGAPAVFQMPYPYNPNFDDKIAQALTVCSTVAIIVSELHADSTEFILNHQNPKIKYFICGFIAGYEHQQWMDWFITTIEFYKNNTILDQLNTYMVKPKTFDVLLGWAKPHRQKIYDFIQENNLADRVILTYLQDRSLSLQKQPTDSWIWPDMDLPDQDLLNTITPIKYKSQQTSLSQVIVKDIYNQTAYTIIAETNWANHYNFYTEKVVKPILAKRLFIVFSGQYYLRNLRRLGFQTFNGIIDESYDSVENSEIRFSMALEQMQDLINQPQEKILALIKPIVEHNQQVMLETDWYGNFAREFESVVLDHTR